MNIGFWSCIILVIPFMIIGVLFAVFKEKAAKFVSGFNSFSKEEQALYDKAHISRDIRNQCFVWTIIMLAGALLSCFLTPYMAIPAYIIWLILFFREVHFDENMLIGDAADLDAFMEMYGVEAISKEYL